MTVVLENCFFTHQEHNILDFITNSLLRFVPESMPYWCLKNNADIENLFREAIWYYEVNYKNSLYHTQKCNVTIM